MSLYVVRIDAKAAKDFRNLDPVVRRRLLRAIDHLAEDPRPPGHRALRGRAGYRIRVGDFRVIYEIHDQALLVVVVKAGPRGSVYRP